MPANHTRPWLALLLTFPLLGAASGLGEAPLAIGVPEPAQERAPVPPLPAPVQGPVEKVLWDLRNMGITPDDPDPWVDETGDMVIGDLRFVDLDNQTTARITVEGGHAAFGPLDAASLATTGGASIGGDLAVAGAGGFGGALSAASASFGPLAAGATSIAGALQASGAADIGGPLTAASAVFGPLTAQTASITGMLAAGGLEVASATDLPGGLSTSTATVHGLLSADAVATPSLQAGTATVGTALTLASGNLRVAAGNGVESTGKLRLTTLAASPIELAPNGATALTVASGGNVGIGTASPVAKLDVQGNLNFNGQKACVVSVGGGLHALLVPAGWTTSTCSSWAIALGGSVSRHACIFATSFTLSAGPGALPSPNCGW